MPYRFFTLLLLTSLSLAGCQASYEDVNNNENDSVEMDDLTQDSGTNSDSNSDTESNVGSDKNTDTGSNTNSDTANDSDTNTNTETDSETEIETETETETETESDSEDNKDSTNANTKPQVAANLTLPNPGTQLSSSVIFKTDSNLIQWLYVGSVEGGKDIFNGEFNGETSLDNVPQNGQTVFVTLWSTVNGAWQKKIYEFISVKHIPDTDTDADSDTSTQPKKNKVLIVGMDGVQFEKIALASTPKLDALTITRAYAGGIPNTATQQQTYSGPGWSSLLTGVWDDQHQIISNGSGQAEYPSVFERLEKATTPLYSASIWNWPNPNNNYFASDKVLMDVHMQNLNDAQVITEAKDLILNQGFDVVFAGLDEADHVGHSEGFSDNYLNTISLLDQQLGELMNAVKVREVQFNEDWLVLVVTDHGRAGYGSSHGGQSEQERTVFIASNKNIKRSCTPDQDLLDCPSQVDVTPTVLAHMGIDIQASWNLQGHSLFGQNMAEDDDKVSDNNSSDQQHQHSENSDVANYRHWAIGGPSSIIIPNSGINGLTQLDGKNVAQLRAVVSPGSYSEMSVPLNPYTSNDPFNDPALDLSNTQSTFVTVTYQSNHDAILQLRQSGVHGGSHNQASLPASPNGFSTLTLSLSHGFKWLGHSPSTLDLSKLGKFNFAFLSQNNNDGYAQIIVSGLEIENYQPQN